MSPYSSGLASLVAWIILDSPYLLYPSADNYPVQENGICFGIKQAELEICSSLFPVTLGLLIYLLSCSCFSFEKIAIIPYKHKIVIINDACLIGPQQVFRKGFFHSLIISQTNFPGALFYVLHAIVCLSVMFHFSPQNNLLFALPFLSYTLSYVGLIKSSLIQSFVPMDSHIPNSVLIRTRLPLTYDYTSPSSKFQNF